MAGVELVDFGIRQVALERLATGRDERGIVPPPDHQRRRPVRAQPRLPCRIGRDIGPVVVQQIGLDLALAGFRQVGIFVGPGVRIITFGMRGAERMTLFGRGERYEPIEHLRMRFGIGPILRNAGPLGAKAFLIDVGILDDKRLQPLPMRRHDAKADRAAIVMKEERVGVDLELLEESADRLGKIVEGVHVGRRRRSVAPTESRKIGRYQMIACREQGDECIELTRRRREAVQQHDRRRVLRTRFAIENSDTIDRHAAIGRCRRRRLQRSTLPGMTTGD